jgi:hypothetical protein
VSRLLAFVRTRAGFVAATIGIVLAVAGVAAALVPRGSAPQTRSVQPTLPAPTAATTALADVDRELRRLPFGRISFTVPDSLELGDTVVLRLVLSLEESVSQLQRRISAIARAGHSRNDHGDQSGAAAREPVCDDDVVVGPQGG